ncbi:MAG: hypothetical protein WBA77_20205 [Microcoleaceae cyanobacterium]
MKNFLGCLLGCGCIGMSLFFAVPGLAETNNELDKNLTTVSSTKAIETHLQSISIEDTVVIAETEVADSSNSTEAITEQPSTRQPLPCRIFPAASMQQ